jgi:osmotically-inducible protein OsmY
MAQLFKLFTGILFVGLLTGCANDPGKRTVGVVIDDQGLEWTVGPEIRNSDPGFKGAHIVVVSYNGVVLLAGQVASEALKEKAAEVAQSLNSVRKVHNELTVSGPISFASRTNDSWLTSKVKSRLIWADEAYGRKTKVVTENGVVYLMGLLTREQADNAVAVTSKVYGVEKIVRVFEYI